MKLVSIIFYPEPPPILSKEILEESKNNLFEFYSKTFPIFYKYRTGKWRGEWKFVFKSDYLGVCYLL